MVISTCCQALFVDQSNSLYCSVSDVHQIVTKSLNDPTNTLSIVAGTGCSGSGPDMLSIPSGIFVDLSSSFYVADRNNHRIQYFAYGNRNATTVAGNGASGTFYLNYPRDVVLDGNNYLFVVDTYNHRIIRSGPNGFRCVAGCMNTSGLASNQLTHPHSMSFDSDGNIWVADTDNGRIQKFILNNVSTSKFHAFFRDRKNVGVIVGFLKARCYLQFRHL